MPVRYRPLRVVASALVTVVAGCGSGEAVAAPNQGAAVAVLRPVVIAEMPHDPAAFTEGLEVDGPRLYESTGLYGKSELRELDPATGEVLRSAPLAPDQFGEGIAVVGDRIWQLTWQNGVAIEWDKNTFTQLREVPMDGEGWGLCYDGIRLVRSDGSDRLRFHDPETFAEIGSVAVTAAGQPLKLNAIACADGQVWANVWPTDQIVRIDPANGAVTASVDASGLLDQGRRAHAGVLNGIVDAANGEFLLTGKNWPAMFRVRFG